MLTKEQILAADDLKTETVDVPEWGGQVQVGTLSAAERDKFDAIVAGQTRGGKTDMAGLRLHLVALVLRGSDGQPLFGANDMKALEKKSAAAIQRVFEVAARLNGLGAVAAEDARGN